MHLQNYIVQSTLLLLLIAEVVQCSPVDNSSDPSVYDKLVELSTNQKCTYLQSSLLLKNDNLQFLKDCSYRDITAANFSTVSLYDLEKLHCLIYYNIFEELCMKGQEVTVMSLNLKAAERRVKVKEVGGVCGTLRKFYGSQPQSSLASIISEGDTCERICSDLQGHYVMVPCQLSALMAFATDRTFRSKFQKPIVTSAQIAAQESSAPDVTTNTQIHAGALNSGSVIAQPIENGQTFEKQQPAAKDDQLVPAPKKTSSQGGTVDNEQIIKKKVKLMLPLAHSSNPVPLDTNQIAQTTLKVTTNKAGESVNEGVVRSGPNLSVPTQNQNPSQPVEYAVEKQSTKVTTQISTTESSADIPKQDIPPPDTALDSKKSGEAKSEKTVADPQNDAALSSPIEDTGKVEKDEEPYNQDSDDGNPVFDGDEEELEPPLPKEKQHSANVDNDLLSISAADLPSNDSYFFSYFMMFCILFAMGYVGYHNKQKILALVLEGRRGRRQPRRRPNSANYHKLDSNLEEAVTSSCDKTTSNVIY